MLVVDPKQRYTAVDVLNHQFFSQYVVDEVRQFSPYRKFKVRSYELKACGLRTSNAERNKLLSRFYTF